MSTIQVLKPKFHIDECLAQIRECLEKGWTGSGFKTAELETAWKAYTAIQTPASSTPTPQVSIWR